MAETLSAVRPSKAIYNALVTSTSNPISNLFDTDDSNYAYTASSTSKSAILGGFDFSSIPDNAKITDISVSIKGRAVSNSTYTMRARLVKNGTSTGDYTDMGDGLQQFYKGNTTTTNTISFPNAATNSTPNFLKSGGLQLFLYQSNGPHYIYFAYISVTYEVPVIYTITANAGTGGTVTGGGEYENGTTATLTATANVGYVFKQWSDGNTNATRTITVTANATYTAEFEKVYTSNLFVGTQRVTAYCGTQKMCSYCGTQKI